MQYWHVQCAREGRMDGWRLQTPSTVTPRQRSSCRRHTPGRRDSDAILMGDGLAALGIAKSLVIHLDRSAGREVPLLKEAAAQGVSLNILRATDGRNDLRFRSQLFPSRAPAATCADIIGAIFDSHRRAWEAAAATSDGHVLVLEDDVALPGNFTSILGRRMRDLPPSFDLAMLGTTSAMAQVMAHPGSRHLLRPNADDPNKQQLLGFWAYIVSRGGAQKMLRLHDEARADGHGGLKRFFQPVDLFVSHRLHQIETYIFKPPAPLAAQLAKHPSPTIETHTPLGIITHRRGPESTNGPMKSDGETATFFDAGARMGEHFNANRFADALVLADATIASARTHPCWHAATFLQNTGLTLLRVLNVDQRRADTAWASSTLLAAHEAFAGAVRYGEGTYEERNRRQQFGAVGHGWIGYALGQRHDMGLPPIASPLPARVALPHGLTLFPASFVILEPEIAIDATAAAEEIPLTDSSSARSDHGDHQDLDADDDDPYEPRFDANGPGTFSVSAQGRVRRR